MEEQLCNLASPRANAITGHVRKLEKSPALISQVPKHKNKFRSIGNSPPAGVDKRFQDSDFIGASCIKSFAETGKRIRRGTRNKIPTFWREGQWISWNIVAGNFRHSCKTEEPTFTLEVQLWMARSKKVSKSIWQFHTDNLQSTENMLIRPQIVKITKWRPRLKKQVNKRKLWNSIYSNGESSR